MRSNSRRGLRVLGRAMLASGIVMILVGTLGSMALASHAPLEPDSICLTRPSGVPSDYECAILDEQSPNPQLEGEVWWTRDSNNDLVLEMYTVDPIDNTDGSVQVCARNSEDGGPYASDKCSGNRPDRVYEGDPTNPGDATYDHGNERVLLTIDLDDDPPDIDPNEQFFWQVHVTQDGRSTVAGSEGDPAGTTTTTTSTTSTTIRQTTTTQAETTTTGDPGETTTTGEAAVGGVQLGGGNVLPNTGIANPLPMIALAGQCLTLGGILLTFGERQARRREEWEMANSGF
jgi:hypothetical protein